MSQKLLQAEEPHCSILEWEENPKQANSVAWLIDITFSPLKI